MTSLDSFSDEIIQTIVKHVNRTDLLTCTLLNKRFHTISQRLLWRNVEIGSRSHFVQLITCLFYQSSSQDMGQHIRHLDIGFEMTDDTFLLFLPHLRHVETLILRGMTSITDTSFRHLPMYCLQLTLLQLWAPMISAYTFARVCHQLPQLTSLGFFEDFPDDSPDLFSFLLVDDVYRLEHIELGNGWQMTENTVMDLALFRGLKRLTIDGIQDDLLQFMFTTTTTATLGDDSLPWLYLTHMTLHVQNDDDGYNNYLDPMTIFLFIKSHPTLKHFTMTGLTCTDQTLDTMASLLSGVVMAIEVTTSGRITDEAVCRFVQKCRLLRSIMIISRVYDDDVDGKLQYDYRKILDQAGIKKIQEQQQESSSGTTNDNNNNGCSDGNEDHGMYSFQRIMEVRYLNLRMTANFGDVWTFYFF